MSLLYHLNSLRHAFDNFVYERDIKVSNNMCTTSLKLSKRLLSDIAVDCVLLNGFSHGVENVLNTIDIG